MSDDSTVRPEEPRRIDVQCLKQFLSTQGSQGRSVYRLSLEFGFEGCGVQGFGLQGLGLQSFMLSQLGLARRGLSVRGRLGTRSELPLPGTKQRNAQALKIKRP